MHSHFPSCAFGQPTVISTSPRLAPGEGTRPSQTIVEGVIPVAEIVSATETEEIAKSESQRRVGTIERRRGVLGSKPVIAGTRIPVQSVRRLHDDGADEAEILEMYPDLTRSDVRAALARSRSHAAPAPVSLSD